MKTESIQLSLVYFLQTSPTVWITSSGRVYSIGDQIYYKLFVPILLVTLAMILIYCRHKSVVTYLITMHRMRIFLPFH